MLGRHDQLFLLGNELGQSTLGIWEFDLTKNSWKTLRSSGKGFRGRRMPAGGVYGDQLFCFGGKDDEVYLSDFGYYDLVRQEWSEVHLDLTPSARYAAAWCQNALGFWLFGGLGDKGLSNDLWFFDFSAHTFRCLDPGEGFGGIQGQTYRSEIGQAPSRRYGAAMVATPSALYLFGGYTSRSDYNVTRRLFNDLWRYDLEKRSWTCLSPDTGQNYSTSSVDQNHPLGRYCHVMTAYQEKLLIGFGSTGGENGFGWKFLVDTWGYDLNLDRWFALGNPITSKPHQESSLKAPAFCQLGSQLYLYGGQTPENHSAKFFCFDLNRLTTEIPQKQASL